MHYTPPTSTKRINPTNENVQHQVNSVHSPKLKLGHSAAVLARRKASISALEDISNSETRDWSARELKPARPGVREVCDRAGVPQTTPQIQNKCHGTLRADSSVNSSHSAR